MSEPAQNFIRLRNGLKQIDDNSLDIRALLMGIEKLRDDIQRAESEIRTKKSALAESLESTISETEVEGNISNLIQKMEEELETSIQAQKNSISESLEALDMYQDELADKESELDNLFYTNQRYSDLRFLVQTGLLVLVFWIVLEASNRTDGQVIESVWNLTLFFGILRLVGFGVWIVDLLYRKTSPPKTLAEKREKAIYIQGARVITTQIDDLENRIRGRRQSVKDRKKNITDCKLKKLKLEDLETKAMNDARGLQKKHEYLRLIEQEIASKSLKVLELEKENAEIWTSISDLIPSEFQ